MLTLRLALEKQLVNVHVNGEKSHSFPLKDLALTGRDVEEFFDSPAKYGGRLYRALFAENSAARSALKSLTNALGAAGRVALSISDAALNQFPWEYLHDGQNYLAAQRAFTRTVGAEAMDFQVEARLPLLFLPADPLLFDGDPPMYHLGVDTEWDELVKVLREHDPAVDLEKVEPPTLKALQARLAGKHNAIIHFTGHGDLKNNEARLIFEHPDGSADAAPASQVSAQWRGRAALVVLSACLSAVPGEGAEANLARSLCEQGAPFVLGMQMVVPDFDARKFTETFYRFLLAGDDIYEAMRQARLTILPDSELAMGIPVLYAADAAQAGMFRPGGSGLTVREKPRPGLEGLPTVESGFFGRQDKLVEIGKHLTADRPRSGETHPSLTVTLHGPGGIGKTALLVKAAQRFAWKFAGVLSVPLEPLPSPEGLLDRLEKALALNPDPAASSEARFDELGRAMQGGGLLLALDNYESVFYAEGARRSEAAQLHAFFEQLPARGVTLLISSRESTGLPGERLVKVSGLDDHSGGQMFYKMAEKRRAELDESACRAASHAVGGHPLAIRLVAPVFDAGEGASLKDFLARLDETLKSAARKMADGKRHDTLQACFDFSLAHFEKSAPELVKAIARLSEFRAAFLNWLAAPALFGRERIFESEESQEQAQAEAAKLLHRLYDGGLLEREILPIGENETLTFYSLHPALRPFAAERLSGETKASAEDGYFLAMQHLGRTCYPGNKGGGIYARPILALTAGRALPDLRRAALLRTDADSSNLCFNAAFLLIHFGDLDGAMQLYGQVLQMLEGLGDLQGKSATLHQMAGIYVRRGDLEGAMQLYRQSLEMDEGLGDLQGKSATLHQMAGIYVTRGDLEGAMQLYRQSLEIKEGLGDLKGKSATLANMGGVLYQKKNFKASLKALWEAWITLEKIGATPDARTVANLLVQFRGALGPEKFEALWQQEIAQPLPEWLAESQTSEVSETSEVSVEQFIAGAIRSMKEKKPEAEQYYEAARKMAGDSSAPEELRALGRVLQRVLIGDTQADTSSLPEGWAQAVRKAMG